MILVAVFNMTMSQPQPPGLEQYRDLCDDDPQHIQVQKIQRPMPWTHNMTLALMNDNSSPAMHKMIRCVCDYVYVCVGVRTVNEK